METHPCPPPEATWKGCSTSRLDAARLPHVSAHVASCRACQTMLESLTAGPSPDASSWCGPTAADSRLPPPAFLDRMKQTVPAPRPSRAIVPQPAAPANAAPPTEPFPILERYEILGVLGRGAEAVVYKARRRAAGRVVALKMLRDCDRARPEAVARLRAEAETLARLRHPNVVRIHEVGDADGRPFLAMEYIDGGTLSARLAGGSLPARESAALVEVLALACPRTRTGRASCTATSSPPTSCWPATAWSRQRSATSAWRGGCRQARARRAPAGCWARRPTWPRSRRAAKDEALTWPATSTHSVRFCIAC